jgi:hypothetical protein
VKQHEQQKQEKRVEPQRHEGHKGIAAAAALDVFLFAVVQFEGRFQLQ